MKDLRARRICEAPPEDQPRRSKGADDCDPLLEFQRFGIRGLVDCEVEAAPEWTIDDEVGVLDGLEEQAERPKVRYVQGGKGSFLVVAEDSFQRKAIEFFGV